MLPDKELGFGLMRLPKEKEAISLEKTIELADHFLASGLTYFDTAYVYEGSEEIFRKAVAERHPRTSYTIADKLAAWKLDEGFTAEDMLRESLQRTGAGYFDFYLLHSLQQSRAEMVDRLGCWEFLRSVKERGLARMIGFSYHGDAALLEKLLKEHPEVDFVQLQINFMDWENPIIESRSVYETARRFGKPIVVMEPVKGGLLAPYADLAIRFALNLEGVHVVLSGMNTMEMLNENIRSRAPLAEEEKRTIESIVAERRARNIIECTACRYCTKGCPAGIDIPDIFSISNELSAHGEHNRPHFFYNELLASGRTARAAECIECGSCAAVCPQHLDIPALLKKASALIDRP